MESENQGSNRRPRIVLGAHTHDTGPVLQVVGHGWEYELDEVTAVYWCNVLMNYIWHKLHTDRGPSYCLYGDK